MKRSLVDGPRGFDEELISNHRGKSTFVASIKKLCEGFARRGGTDARVNNDLVS